MTVDLQDVSSHDVSPAISIARRRRRAHHGLYVARWIKIAVAAAAMAAVLFVLIHPFINLAPTALRAFRRGQQLLHSIAAVVCADVSLLMTAISIPLLTAGGDSPAPPPARSACSVLLC